MTFTRPSLQPRPSATICATMVSEPCPISLAPVYTTTPPSRSILMFTVECGMSERMMELPAHRSAGRLVGEHAITVVANVRNVVQRAQQRAGIKNGDHAVRAIRAAILDHFGGNRGDAAIALDAGLQINDGPRPSAMRPKNFFARVRNLHRRF